VDYGRGDTLHRLRRREREEVWLRKTTSGHKNRAFLAHPSHHRDDKDARMWIATILGGTGKNVEKALCQWRRKKWPLNGVPGFGQHGRREQ